MVGRALLAHGSSPAGPAAAGRGGSSPGSRVRTAAADARAPRRLPRRGAARLRARSRARTGSPGRSSTAQAEDRLARAVLPLARGRGGSSTSLSGRVVLAARVARGVMPLQVSSLCGSTAAIDDIAAHDEVGAAAHEDRRDADARRAAPTAPARPSQIFASSRWPVGWKCSTQLARRASRRRCRGRSSASEAQHQREEEERRREDRGEDQRRSSRAARRLKNASQPPRLEHAASGTRASAAPADRRRSARAGPPRGSRRRRGSRSCSATSRAKLISCVAMIIVMPISLRSRTSCSTSLTSCGSSALVISSSSISFGSIASARTIATRCCWPPESRSGNSSAFSRRPMRSSNS